MSKWLVGGGIAAVSALVLGGVALAVVMWVFSIFNGEIGLKNTYLAKKKAVETSHDTMWKTIS